jgi:adenylate cyclase
MSETRKIAAILCADVVGYSRLAGADEDRTLSRLRGLRSDLIDPAIAAHHGRIVKRTGDGILVEFRSVVDAVRCALEVQNAMVERNAGVFEDRWIVFRIGIHLGDVVEESDGDLMGDGVNIAARLEGIAEPGAICLSEDAYRQVKGRLDLKVTDLGPTRLKNIAEPIRAYSLQVGVSAEAKLAAEPAAQAKPSASKTWRGWATGAALAALLVVIAGGSFLAVNRQAPVSASPQALVVPSAPTPTEAARLSIVVLSFNNLSGDPSQDYLADVLTDELTTSLARIPDSFVIGRNTAFTYKGKPVDAKVIGRDLGVRYVLEGSVEPGSSQVRVNAQLIGAESGAHLWAEQFDTARADILQMQDEIVTHLAHALEIQLPYAEAARLKRASAANPDAADLAMQCVAAIQRAGFIGGEAASGFQLCQRALDADPNNVSALSILSKKFSLLVAIGQSADPAADLQQADGLVSKALALDPDYADGHLAQAQILLFEGRIDEAIAESERALALDPAVVEAYENLGFDYLNLGQFEKSLEYYNEAIRLSPRDPALVFWYGGKTAAHFALKQYDQAIVFARRALAINSNHNPLAHGDLIAAFALTGHDAEAREALRRYLAQPTTSLKTVAAWKAYRARTTNRGSDPRILESDERTCEGLRKAGMPEK